METEKIVTYECKVCGRRLAITRFGSIYEQSIFCCGVASAELGQPKAAAAPKPAVKKTAAKKPAAKKPAAKPAKKAAKKPAGKKTAVKKTAKKAVKKKAAKKR